MCTLRMNLETRENDLPEVRELKKKYTFVSFLRGLL